MILPAPHRERLKAAAFLVFIFLLVLDLTGSIHVSWWLIFLPLIIWYSLCLVLE